MPIGVPSGSRIILLLHLLSFLSIAMAQNLVDRFCSDGENNTASLKFTYNLDRLFNQKLYDEGGKSFYHKLAAGENPDKVYVIYLCQSDIAQETCLNCIANAIDRLVKECHDRKTAVIWYYGCLVRYSNIPFFSTLDSSTLDAKWNTKNMTQPDEFSGILNKTFNDEIVKASLSSLKYATKEVNISNNETVLYSLVQCLPDLSTMDCRTCLNVAVNTVVNGPLGTIKRGARILTPSCTARYELYPFYGNPTHPVEASGDVGNKGKKQSRAWIPIAIASSPVAAVVLFSYFLWRMWRENKRNKEERTNSQQLQLLHLGKDRFGNDGMYDILQVENQVESHEFPLLPLHVILEATKHFSNENKLGEGGFGPVYKGILEDDKEIAVKRLSKKSGQGLREFINEVTLIAKLQHKNLVRLLGCCLEQNELLLIYEFMPNKSLDFLLFDSTRSIQLEWKTRISIINGIARGLLYLHEDSRLRIIHRDLKTSNVLLDHEMNPKISDFGMARIFGGNQNEVKTNRVVGTYGYMAPEYAMKGLFSVKSDVYSFGVLLLEIISGRKNNGYLPPHDLSLIDYTWKLWCEEQALELMDPVLVQSCVPDELIKYIHIGLLCVQEDPINRPTMSSVVVMLASDSIKLPQPTQPAFSVGRVVARLDQPSVDVKVCSINEVTLTNVSPR